MILHLTLADLKDHGSQMATVICGEAPICPETGDGRLRRRGSCAVATMQQHPVARLRTSSRSLQEEWPRWDQLIRFGPEPPVPSFLCPSG